jgi:hypothetical protein
MLRRFVQTSSFAGAVVAALLLAQPTLAYTETNTTGITGPHSLTDTSAKPGAVCTYKHYVSEFSNFLITQINVNPPLMKATPGEGPEQVGWNYTVQRRNISFSSGPWMKRYTSPTWRTMTDATHYASFTQEKVRVAAPKPGADQNYQYRVFVKLFWYESTNGPVLGTATERIDWYTDETSSTLTSEPHDCFAWY